MSRVPVITSPCPLRWSSMPKPGQDFCGQCQRQVHNLDLMSAQQRSEFMQSCSGEVCVTYSVSRPSSARNVALGLGLAVGMASGSVVAQDAVNLKQIESKLVQSVEETKANEAKELVSVMVMGGTILDPETSRWVDESEIEVGDAKELPTSTETQWLKTPEKNEK
jgi:hypothetical protein